MKSLFDLSDKVILITGGYGHLGKSAVNMLAFHGARVYVLGKDEAKFNSTFKEDLILSENIKFRHCDISDTSSIASSFEEICKDVGRIDVLINNAAYTKGKYPDNMLDEEWEIGLDGVLGSVYRCIRQIIPYFKEAGSGNIINVSSMYGIVAPDFDIYNDYPAFISQPNYGAAKAGVIQLTKYFASYLGKKGITVNVISPGPFPTHSIQENTGFIDELSKRTCLNRIGTPQDLAGAFVFLASDAARFITGQNLVIDGGWTVR